MAFISSSCIKHNRIIDSVQDLHAYGFSEIELSGGTKPYKTLIQDLEAVQKELGVSLLLHNYFPPPQEDFVLNLASVNDKVYQQSIEHCKRAIDISAKLGTRKFGFHAGFFIDIKVSEIGKKLSPSDITDKNEAFDRFCKAHGELKKFAGNDVILYVENNVFSFSNNESFEGQNPLMVTDLSSYQELKERIDFNLLLDVAHLKVSCQTLEKDFNQELDTLFKVSDYIHLSDNDGLHDTNDAIEMESPLYSKLQNLNWKNKTVTLEIYEPLEKVKTSLDHINLLLNA
ncbi:MAG: sugar phosphate isomerase/epimerase family protein [Crocinitomicaceae bacterium]